MYYQSTNEKQPKAALYIRVSTIHQIDKDSLKVQEKELINYARYILDIDDYEIFIDAGYSGKDTIRPEYQNMLLKMRNHQFTHLLVWKIDRISRNLIDFVNMYEELNALDVTFISKNEQFDTSSAIGEAMLKIILIFAELERKMTSERVTATLMAKARAGDWNGGRVSLGYNYDSQSKEFSIHPKESETIRLIYNLYEENFSLSQIARHLNSTGLTTRNRKLFSATTVYGILKNHFYEGTLIYNKHQEGQRYKSNPIEEWIIHEDHHIPIISKEQYARCQSILISRCKSRTKKKYDNQHIFSGLLYCYYCDTLFSAQTGRHLMKKDIRLSSYLCYARRHHKCENAFTCDSVIGPFILNYIINVYRLHKSFTKTTTIKVLERKLLRGPSFDQVNGLEPQSLKSIYKDLSNGCFKYCIPEFSQHKPVKMSLLSQREDSANFQYEHFIVITHNFILAHNINTSRYIDYLSLVKKIGRIKMKNYFNEIIDKCYMKDGKIESIICKTGQKHIFMHS